MPSEGDCETVSRLHILSNNRLWGLYPITEFPYFIAERSEVPRTRGIDWRTAPQSTDYRPWDIFTVPDLRAEPVEAVESGLFPKRTTLRINRGTLSRAVVPASVHTCSSGSDVVSSAGPCSAVAPVSAAVRFSNPSFVNASGDAASMTPRIKYLQ